MADVSDGFSLGDIGTALASVVSGAASGFTAQIAQAAKNQETNFSQSIVNHLKSAEQDTSKFLGLSRPAELAKNALNTTTNAAVKAGGAIQSEINKLTGWNLTKGQITAIFAGLVILIVGALWTRSRS